MPWATQKLKGLDKQQVKRFNNGQNPVINVFPDTFVAIGILKSASLFLITFICQICFVVIVLLLL